MDGVKCGVRPEVLASIRSIGGRRVRPMRSELAGDRPIGDEDAALTGQHFHGSQTFSVLLPRFFKMDIFQENSKIDLTNFTIRIHCC